ncbi:MAG TPA: GrpB family protein [Fimbriimonas sp.]|nr:GrpB family protein [Fimbriimonas sp.]
MIEIVPYRDSWPDEFLQIGKIICEALGEDALAIHHIGSTSVPGLDAKNVIDIQVTVADLELPIEARLSSAGFSRVERILTDHCPPGMILASAELDKRVYGFTGRRVHLHVRAAGRFNQRYALLCRDYLRSHPRAADAYAEIKRQLARYFPDDVGAYYDIKDPVFDVLMAAAEEWAKHVAWTLPGSDVD